MEIIIGVISGLITFGVIELVRFGYFKSVYRKFKAVFGDDIVLSDGFHLVYAELLLPPDITTERYPYSKPGTNSQFRFSIERPISSCEIRAAKYLSETIAKETKSGVSLSSDIELKNQLDISFITFGGPTSNFKTKDVIENISNNLVKFDNTKFTSARTEKNVLKPEAGYDYGLILKIRPSQFPNRTWFTCAGIGEWGSSGAAWYLAKKWREINAFAGNSSFALIVRVKQNQDQSAEPVLQVKRPEDLARYEE